ncbi:MAG TPA: TonB-dependent receptor [Candidatus Acidoferrales bacterium]|nr:TonB-dependent receptor [Candidatus Acidoferrales bacterium]
MAATQRIRGALYVCLFLAVFAAVSNAQTGNSSTITGTVVDSSGGVVPGATVTIHDPVSGFQSSATTDKTGAFSFPNVPFNPYHLSVTAKGFSPYAQDVEVRSSVPVDVKITLSVAGAATTVTVEAAADLIETDSTAHTDIDRTLFDKLPLESPSSSVSSLVTLASPGVAADSNGLFHGLGDHAENSFSVDGQPITDQQSKVFSNQIPVDSIQSLEVIDGAPPAEYGDKTSLVIDVTTRSGEGVTTPHGTVTASYGTFGTSNAAFDLAYGGQKWGNFISVSGLDSGRFLDPPEFTVMHDKGNEENVFDRVDYRLSNADSLQLNLGYTRSWFQNPNSFDQKNHPGLVNNVTGNPLESTDQRSKIGTFNIAPTWTRLLNSTTVLTFGGFVRQDQYNYYPSTDPLADLAPDLQAESFGQHRKLTNAGLRSDISYVKGMHNLKVGAAYEQTFLTENDQLGIVDPTLNPVCFNADGSPNTNPAVTSQNQCGGPLDLGGSANSSFKNFLLPFDLTRGGALFPFNGRGDIKELALYIQDTITKGSWSFNLGIRGDLYNGFASARQAEPRVGIAYNIKSSSTVLRVSYARTLETPFNENLVIASTGCQSQVLAAIVPPPGVSCNLGAIQPGWRNEFHTGLQQAFGSHFVVDGEYIWKYTHNGYDFGVVGATPLTFPIEWHNSKITGFTVRANVPNYRGLSAFVSMSSVAARFFLPQVAGIPIIPPSTGVFRIDHDEKFNQTTHLQYQPWKTGPWIGFNWRYDSGLVAGATPCFNPLTATCQPSSTTLSVNGQPEPAINLVNTITGAPLTADQEFQAGFTCNGVAATPTQALPSPCLASQFGSTLIKVPAPGTENDDHNPQRIQPRNLFDLSVGEDNLFHGDRYRWSLQFTAINVTNKVALYNFLSTFSGTHYVTPRTLTAEIGFHF